MVTRKLKAAVRKTMPRKVLYEGDSGTTCVIGEMPSVPNIATVTSGNHLRQVSSRRILPGRLPGEAHAAASEGDFVVAVRNSWGIRGSIEIPLTVQHAADLPETVEEVLEMVRTSSNKEDLRRIRKNQFEYHPTRDPELLEEFYCQHCLPYLTARHMEEAHVPSLEKLSKDIEHGGELIRVMQDGQWVAGIVNQIYGDRYCMGSLGLRNGDPDGSIRQLRTIPGLLIYSMQRAIERGFRKVSIGSSLPLLGDGNARFKTKWGGALRRETGDTGEVLCDLRHERIRSLLQTEPLIFCFGAGLGVVRWVSGVEEVAAVSRDIDRISSVDHWYVVTSHDLAAEIGERVGKTDAATVIGVNTNSDTPIWLGDLFETASSAAGTNVLAGSG